MDNKANNFGYEMQALRNTVLNHSKLIDNLFKPKTQGLELETKLWTIQNLFNLINDHFCGGCERKFTGIKTSLETANKKSAFAWSPKSQTKNTRQSANVSLENCSYSE